VIYTLRVFSSKMQFLYNSKVFGFCIIHILYTGCTKIKKTNSGAKKVKHGIYSPFFLLKMQFFIILKYLVPVLFTFYIEGVLKFKINSGAKRLNMVYTLRFFSSKCSLSHTSNVFGSSIIHVLYTGCTKI
jgi:hypothetical protein